MDTKPAVGSIEAILDAAEVAILEFGMDKVTIDEMAQLADVSRATFYRRVGGREAVITLLLRREIEPFVRETESASDGAESFPARIKAGLIHAIKALPNYPLLNQALRSALSPYNLRIVRPIYQDLATASFEAAFKNARAARAIPDGVNLDELSEWLMRNFLHIAADGPHERNALEHYIDNFIVPVISRPAGRRKLAIDNEGHEVRSPAVQAQLDEIQCAVERFSSEIQVLRNLLAAMNAPP